MSYLALKHIHMTLAIVSIFGFALRSFWLFKGSALLAKKPVKILPHIVDTFLLGTGIALMITSNQHPTMINWLMLKIFLIITYIVFGMIMFKAQAKSKQALFFVLAMASIIGVLYLARFKSLPFLS